MKRALKIFALLSVLTLALFFIASHFIGKHWGRDVAQLNVSEGEFKFTASRDEGGVWDIKVADENSLWFAFGYVQALDREFQTELFRHIATGQLSSLFGETQISRDRLMRFSSRVAQKEWADLPEDHLLKKSARAYVLGRNKLLASDVTESPVEWRMIRRDRKSFPAWEPWEVLAIVRFHTWEFSFDVYEEIRELSYSKLFGKAEGPFLYPKVKMSAKGLYEQPGVSTGVRPRLFDGVGIKEPSFFYTDASLNALRTGQPFPEKFAMNSPFSDSFRELGFGAEEGASNLWMIADPRTGLDPTLCNDTHLAFSYPSPLYPAAYEIAGKIRGRGYMLPGLPAVVIGSTQKEATEEKLVWGITMGSYGDSQDLIEIESQTLAAAKIKKETYVITDPTSGVTKKLEIDESWTSFGPRVDTSFKWPKDVQIPPLALDWIGYRKAPTPLEFFIRRNIMGSTQMREDLAQKWAYPVVNFTWIDSVKGQTRFGHVLTGLTFDRDRQGPRGPISEKLARSRKLSQPKDRPYLDFLYQKKARFVMASGNQKVFPGKISERIGSDWVDNLRAERIVERGDELALKPESSQYDYFSPSLALFYSTLRKEISVNELCANGNSAQVSFCIEIVAGLDRWNRQATMTAWAPTLLFLWLEKTKMGLWPPGVIQKDKTRRDLFVSWARSVASERLLNSLLTDAKERKKWETFSKRSFTDMSVRAFQDSLDLLVTELGPVTDRWSWGFVHRIRWQHPFSLLPEPFGPYLRDSVLGAAPSVPGGGDSPGRFDFEWNPEKPLAFPATHGSVTRMCAEVSDKKDFPLRWSIPTGVSGNPLSEWAKVFPQKFYFQEKLLLSDH